MLGPLRTVRKGACGVRGVDAIIQLLRDEDVDRVFGNPGTTELPFVDALSGAADLPYVLAPHEGALVAMADGYARATRRTSFVNLHVAAGVANGLIGMLNASRSRTPMVITAGQQDSRHLIQDPMLSGDLVGLASPATKWAVEVRRPDELGPLLRRAFRVAAAPPEGPVFVSMPMDLLSETLSEPLPARTAMPPMGPAPEIGAAVDALRGARTPAIVAGDGVGRADALDALVDIAVGIGASVYHAPMNDRLDFPMDHPLYRGMLAPENAVIRQALDPHDVVLLAGVRAFMPHHYSAGPAIGAGTLLVQLDDDAAQIGRTYPVAVALTGGVGATLSALAKALGPPDDAAINRASEIEAAVCAARAHTEASLPAETGAGPLDPRSAAAALAAHLPAGALVVEEAITVGLVLREHLRLREPDSFHHTVGGGLGWGIGSAVGVSMGRPDRPVVAALGDGCALFGLHGLWTAANQRRPVTFVVFNNGEYRTLKQTLTRMRPPDTPARFPGMDLTPPDVDWPALSDALGVRGVRATSVDQLIALLGERTDATEPLLIEVPTAAYGGLRTDGR
jgi:benzoylformate decarboxylase